MNMNINIYRHKELNFHPEFLIEKVYKNKAIYFSVMLELKIFIEICTKL
jgi:hypothetical protein